MDIKALKADLAAVLEKHGVTIDFDCSECSDTHGLYGDGITIRSNSMGTPIVYDTEGSWSLSAWDLRQ